MRHAASQQIAAATADRTRSQAVVRERIARRLAALEAAEIAAGMVASEADADFAALRAAHADVLAGLPPITLDADADIAQVLQSQSDSDATWLDKHLRATCWHDVMKRVRTEITVAMITGMLRMACVAGINCNSASRLLRQRARAAVLRAARDIFSALTRTRFRVAHICITARAMRAGRVAVLASTAPACC